MTIGRGLTTLGVSAISGAGLATAVSIASDDRAPAHRPSPKHRNEVTMLVFGGLFGGVAGVAANQFSSRSLLAVAGIGAGMSATAAAMLYFDRD